MNQPDSNTTCSANVKCLPSAIMASRPCGALENFNFTGIPIAHYPRLVTSLAYIKKAAALANSELGLLEPSPGTGHCPGLRL